MPYVWLRTWQLGIKSLSLHLMRSLLTVLGIFIGVASVIWLLAVGEGISRKAQEQIESLGANNIIVRSVKPPSEVTEGQSGIVPYGITRADYQRLVSTVPTIERAIPVREIRRRFTNQGRLVDGRLVGCTPEYAEMNRLEIDRGRFLTEADTQSRANHCVLAAGTAERLFPLANPIGHSVWVEQKPYVVVGITKSRAPTSGIGGSLSGQDFNLDVYIPIETLWARIGDFIVTRRSGSFEGEMVELSQATFRIDKVTNVLPTSDVLKATLAQFHQSEDYGVTVPLELLEQARTTRMMFILLMGLIAAISLVVGGIGIMNIMLATVTERTREIGIRRALGAKRSDIVRQFLVETVALSALGGVTGILGGLTCGPVLRSIRWMLNQSMPEVMDQLPGVIRTVEPTIVPWSVPLALGIAVSIGVIFGLYPAIRAAKMDPIEALRHE